MSLELRYTNTHYLHHYLEFYTSINFVFFCVQLVWLVRELVKSGIMGADGVVMTLLKQVAGQCVRVCG